MNVFLAKEIDHFRSFLFFLLALGNYLLFYAANILLARSLSIEDFDDYSVAVSITTTLSTIATLGLEKYALRCLPILIDRKSWSLIHGFWRYATRLISLLSFLLFTLLGSVLETSLALIGADYHVSIVIVAAFLPVIAAVLFFVEVATANGAQLAAVAIYRLALPATFLCLLLSIRSFDISLTAVTVALCYGGAWAPVFVFSRLLVRVTMPRPVWKSPFAYQKRKWLRRAIPFLLTSLLLGISASSGIVVLEMLYPSDAVVGTYAVAVQTGTFVVVIATSTNRYYLPIMAVFMERRDEQSMQRTMRQRLTFVSILSLLFLGFVIVFGHAILDLFGPNFNSGYSSLCIIATGAVVTTVFADTPYLLQFTEANKMVVLATALAVVTNISLTVTLAQNYGSIGSAWGYTISMGLLFLILKVLAGINLRRYWRSKRLL